MRPFQGPEYLPTQTLLQEADDSGAMSSSTRISQRASQEETASVGADRSPLDPASPVNTLHRSSLTLWIAGLYSILSIFSWTVLVYLSFYPIASSQLRYRKSHVGNYYPSLDYNMNFAHNEEWVKSIRVLLSLAGVLSIPVASAICAGAAPIYSQRRVSSRDLSLRQVMMLADRCWTNPLTYIRALRGPKAWRRYGSPFLIVAICINFLAFLVAPMQQVFLGSATIRIFDGGGATADLFDIPEQFTGIWGYTNNTIVLATRDFLQKASIFEPMEQLWTRGEGFCADMDENCAPSIATFADISSLRDPFLAELRSGFNTGLIRQFLPRINTSTTIVHTEFPDDCEAIPGSLFVRHDYIGSPNITYDRGPYDHLPWEVTICMPTNVSRSVWKPTRERQDFTEELYVSFSYLTLDGKWIEFKAKITANTTAGYFELPNYYNGGKPGPLLSRQPECGQLCISQFHNHSSHIHSDLYLDAGKGPLQSIALALFGPDAFLATWQQKATNSTMRNAGTLSPSVPAACIGLFPLGGLFEKGYSGYFPCGFSDTQGPNAAVQNFLSSFKAAGIDDLEHAFNVASFLANKAWMRYGAPKDTHTLKVGFDPGKDFQIPTISTAGITIVSTLLTIYLATLVALAIYASRTPRWTDQLDAFAMLRIGSALAPDVPLLAANDARLATTLDSLSGVMGDSMPAHETPGKLWPGGQTPLRARRRYYSYFNLKGWVGGQPND